MHTMLLVIVMLHDHILFLFVMAMMKINDSQMAHECLVNSTIINIDDLSRGVLKVLIIYITSFSYRYSAYVLFLLYIYHCDINKEFF